MEFKTRTGKPLKMMTTTELIDEIAHLHTKYTQVSAKNYRRKKALKQLNKFALVNNKMSIDLVMRNETQRQTIENL